MLQGSSCDAISGAHRIPCSQKNHLMFAYGSFHLIYKRWMEPVIDKKPHLEIQCWYLFDTQTTDLRMVVHSTASVCVWMNWAQSCVSEQTKIYRCAYQWHFDINNVLWYATSYNNIYLRIAYSFAHHLLTVGEIYSAKDIPFRRKFYLNASHQ